MRSSVTTKNGQGTVEFDVHAGIENVKVTIAVKFNDEADALLFLRLLHGSTYLSTYVEPGHINATPAPAP